MPVTSVSNLVTQLRNLQSTTTTPVVRALSAALNDWTDLSRGTEPVPEGVGSAFVLRLASTAEDMGTLFSEPLRGTILTFEEELSMFFGGGEGTAQDYGQRTIDFANLVEDVITVLGSSANWDRTNTGIIKIDKFATSDVKTEDARITGKLTFNVTYERTLA